MIPKDCKRLAEVDFPIAAVSLQSARDKYLRHKPTTTLHTWWAQRPLAACRALLTALLLPDPSDPSCPASFKTKAREILTGVMGQVDNDDLRLRQSLLSLVAIIADPDSSKRGPYLRTVRSLIAVANDNVPPLVADPFAGAGSIPLEALRLSCNTLATDLNPVAALILKTVLADIPKARDAAQSIERAGKALKDATLSTLNSLYPVDPDGRRPVAFLWARTVRCESPKCGSEVPLVRSFWLCKKSQRRRALRFSIKRSARLDAPPQIDFEVFQPSREADVPKTNITRAKATCLCCGNVLSPDRVRAQLRDQKGGADVVFDGQGFRTGGARLLAVVTVDGASTDREYRNPTPADYAAIQKARDLLTSIDNAERAAFGLPWIPDEPVQRVPVPFGVINVWVYGVTQWWQLFTARQRAAIVTLLRTLRTMDSIPPLTRTLLAFAVSKFARHCNANARWNNIVESVEPAFGTPSLPFTWTFPESAVFGPWAENYDGSLEAVVRTVRDGYEAIANAGDVERADAKQSPLPDGSVDVWFTDPPYYDNIPYAYVADFFYVWLRRALGDQFPALFATALTPKEDEVVAYLSDDADATAARTRFESGLTRAACEGRRVLAENGIGCVVFAHKTTEGWEALLTGIISSGWTITASWPISTERAGRIRARESAALAASIHLICRPRPEKAAHGDWAAVIRELPKRVAEWMERLESEGVRGADLVFACIGPALEIYSRYTKVVDAEEREIPLGGDPEAKEPHRRGYLAYVWEVVGRMALEQVLGTAEAKARNGAAGALEEDSRLTALFLWTMQATESATSNGKTTGAEEEGPDDDEEDDAPPTKKKAGFSLPFDVVRRFAQPLGIHLPEWENRIIETEKGVVRLLPVADRAKLLFGNDGADAVATWLESVPARTGSQQMTLFGDEPPAPRRRGRGRQRAGQDVSDDSLRARREATTLDRVHMAMLLQASGRTNALRALLQAEQDRGPDFVRLANALSALYPTGSEEERLLDAMLLAVPR
ncbi:MAG: DUF1156 domain-containing protein [Pirellulales bacterium]|nr:DUF1156 domain-containing protein [Pirellulales bacterium]